MLAMMTTVDRLTTRKQQRENIQNSNQNFNEFVLYVIVCCIGVFVLWLCYMYLRTFDTVMILTNIAITAYVLLLLY